MSSLTVSITIATTQTSGFDEIVDRLEVAGMVVHRQLQSIGVVTGTVEASRLATLRCVDGVLDVEASRRLKCLDEDGDSTTNSG